MRNLFVSIALSVAAFQGVAVAASIDPATVDMPWVNGPARDSRYKLADHANTVHVFEAFSLSCSYCNQNAPAVKAMAAEYAADTRVQFIDLGLDTDVRNIQRWITSHAPTYPVVQDTGRAVWSALMQQNGIPQTFVVACDGNLVGFTIGAWGNAEKATIRNAIAAAKETTCE